MTYQPRHKPRLLTDFACQVRDGMLIAFALAVILYLTFFAL